MEPTQRKVVRISRRKLLFTVIAMAVVVLIAVFLESMDSDRGYDMMFGDRGESVGSSEIPSVAPMPPNDYSGYGYNQQPTVTDTREFLKTSYSAEIETRDVSEAVKDVKAAVRDAEGRVDSSRSSEKNGYISFVVPKSRFEEFRDEIESITHKKLYTESISSENLLSQKQSLEQQTESAKTYLANLEKNKKDLDAKHAQTLASLRNQLTAIQNQLSSVRQTKAGTQDQNQIVALQNQETILMQQEAVLKQSQTRENSAYSSQSENLKTQITQANGSITNLGKQDTQFMDNIETVNGSVSVQWISLWDMAEKLSPIHPTLIIVIIILLALYILNRRGYVPKFELI